MNGYQAKNINPMLSFSALFITTLYVSIHSFFSLSLHLPSPKPAHLYTGNSHKTWREIKEKLLLLAVMSVLARAGLRVLKGFGGASYL